MADSGIRTYHLWLPNLGDSHSYVLFKALTVLKYVGA